MAPDRPDRRMGRIFPICLPYLNILINIDYKEILATCNPADVAFLKSMLDAEGITYFFEGEYFLYIRPLPDPVRLMVGVDQLAQAVELLEDVKLSITGISLDKDNKRKKSKN
jgi:hypothetical protein